MPTFWAFMADVVKNLPPEVQTDGYVDSITTPFLSFDRCPKILFARGA